ncbi:hypothetical protein PGC08_12440 [Brevibacterium sp. BDJS002]|uniref:hypothetical protein n=1 Tax=Brevibacterium sp. BDJS002 TaxID=3020906 RepID=UPI002306EDF8|nr:hypothetical protein [Brevibacterium sp. BDJS002]WCE38815.1 hypothetical protein PGC08_12440 [Brevibacterium sp. BDJS002]
MINLDKLGIALWGAWQVDRFSHAIEVPPVEEGFHLSLPIGRIDVFPHHHHDGENLIVMRWTRLITPGNQFGAAQSLVNVDNDDRALTGDFALVDAIQWGVHDAAPEDKVLQYQLALKNNGNWTYGELASAIELEASQLAALLGRFEDLVASRDENDRTLEEDDQDWPGAVEALLNESTGVAMLGVIFERFEMNSVHEHVFFHPNADKALRDRIIRSWDSAAGMDRPQPYGDPAARSDTFSDQRRESVSYLRSSLD